MKYPNNLIYIFLFVLAQVGLAQNSQIDSMKAILAAEPVDTVRLKTLLDLSGTLFRVDPDAALEYANQAKILAEELKNMNSLGYALKNIGLAYYLKGDYVEVLNYWQQSLAIFQSIDHELGVSNILSNIGAIYFNQGDDPKALEYYLESLKASERLGNKLRIATALSNIGAVYYNKAATHDKALEYYSRSLPISEEIGDQEAIGTTSVNLGELYLEKGEYEKALEAFEKALTAFRKTGSSVPLALNFIGKTYAARNNYDLAIRIQNEAYQLAQSKDDKLQMTKVLLGLAETHTKWGKEREALNYYLDAEKLAEELGSNQDLRVAYEGMAQNFATLKDYRNAFNYQSLYADIKDTLYNAENDRRIEGLQFQFDIEKKEAEIALLNSKNDLQQATIQRASILRNFLFVAAGLLLIIIAGVYYQYWYARKSNKIISEERNRSETILLNILPEETAEELKRNGSVKAKKFELTTVVFTDFKEFTKSAEKHSPEELVKSIDYYFRNFDEITSRHDLEKIKTIGDAYMCAGGLPVPNTTNPQDAIRAAIEMVNFVETTKSLKPAGIIPFDIRIGISSGPVVAGVVGTKKFQYDIWGNTVNVAASMESKSKPGKINISEFTYHLIKDDFSCFYRGEVEAKHGGKLKMYFVEQHSGVEV